MAEVGRRHFLAGVGASAAAMTLGPTRAAGAAEDRFPHGVASFDPTSTSVLLWTRVEPPDTAHLGWEVATDEAMTDVVAQGDAGGPAERDGCVRVEVEGLDPGRVWWYRFRLGDVSSRVGRTRTMPADAADRLRLGLVSCSRYAAGGFAAYRDLAEREVDLVVHVGDYVYEDGGAEVRVQQPDHTCTTLDDYRTRYGQHRLDPDLQALHARHPMVAVWDDHESAGNAWRDGARDHDDAKDGPWLDRLLAAGQARDEWLPGRTGTGADGRLKAWRTLRLGLADLVVLDTRTWGRDRQPTASDDLLAPRELLGDDQHRFAVATLQADDRAPWVVVANQVMLHPLRIPLTEGLSSQLQDRGYEVFDHQALNPDQWDGYPRARERFLVEGVGGDGGVLVLTGDIHSSWAWEGPGNDGGAPTMVEVVAPSVTSTPFAELLPVPAPLAEAGIRSIERDLSFVDLSQHGYVIVDLTADRAQAEWWFVDPASTGAAAFGAARSTPRTVPMHLTEVAEPTEDPAPPTREARTTTSGAGADDDGTAPVAAIPIAAAGIAAVAAAAVAVRRRRQPPEA
jgi:alkaline phosphatase D